MLAVSAYTLFSGIVNAIIPDRPVRFFWVCSLVCSCVVLCSLPVRAQAPLTITEMDTVAIDSLYEATSEEESPWFLVFSMLNVYPKLESEELIRQYLNPGMRLIAPEFQNVRTPGDLRDEHLLWTPEIGIGRTLSPRWAANIYLGYSEGTIRTKATNPSIFGAPLKTDFEIYRSAAYFGLSANFFPWGMPERRDYSGLSDRLQNSKVNLGFRLTHSYAGYKVKVKAAFGEHPDFLDLKLKDNWWVTSFNPNIGADIPINKHNDLILNAGYSFAFTKGYDFDGAGFTIGWKHYFN